jgi:hypothetical protein
MLISLLSMSPCGGSLPSPCCHLRRYRPNQEIRIYRMRRVDCRACGVRVEELPWAIGKHQLTKAYMLFLAHWARKLSWQETAVGFRSTWDKVCQAVEYVVEWGLEHRNLAPSRRSASMRSSTPRGTSI